jgi:photosystem II stability/assembly factor-like uncharacterized protein
MPAEDQSPSRSREGLLAEVRRRAARRRKRRRGIFATLTTLAAAAAIAVPLAVASGGRPTRVNVLGTVPRQSSTTVKTPSTMAPSTTASPSTTANAPAPSSVPTGFVIESFTAISSTQWWVLGSVPCGTQLCSEIAVTTDGGASFRMLPAPGGPYSKPPAGSPPISSIRFADPNDGWVFGPKLYATHDGGQHWAAIYLAGQITALEPGSDQVFAIISPPTASCASSGTCNSTTPAPQLWRTSPTGDGWRVDTAPGGVSVGLAVHGQSVWVINSMPTPDGPAIGTRLLHSGDDGAQFITEPQPVTGIACDYQPVTDQMLWAYCSGGHFMVVYRSTDGGAHFSQTQNVNAIGCPNGSQLAAATPTLAVVACNLGGQPLMRTHDAGSTWTVAQPALNQSGYWSPIGFTTADTGYVLWQDPSGPTPVVQLWRTTNGGATWSGVKSLP